MTTTEWRPRPAIAGDPFYVDLDPPNWRQPHEVGNQQCRQCCCGPNVCDERVDEAGTQVCGGIEHVEVYDEDMWGNWCHNVRCERCGHWTDYE